MTKRPIDKLRESALSMTLSGGGAIREMMSIGGVMHLVTTTSIHEVKLADTIDPGRTNPSIPNTQRKVLDLGSDSPLVCKTLLTAKVLFDAKFLRGGINLDEAISRTLAALRELAAMKELLDQLRADEKAAVPTDGLKLNQDRSLVLPQVVRVEHRCKEFIQKADHALQELFHIAELFYGRIKHGWFEGLLAAVTTQGAEQSEFAKFLEAAVPSLKFIRETRNAIEHPSAHKRVDVANYSMDAAAVIWPPSVAVSLPGSETTKMPLAVFFARTLDHITDVFETTVAFLAEAAIRDGSGFRHMLLRLPAERRHYPDLQYSFGITLNGEVVPIG